MADWSKITTRGAVDDRRSNAPLALGGLGGIGAIAVLILSLTGHRDAANTLGGVLGQLQNSQGQQQSSQFAGVDDYEKFTSTVLGSTNDTWHGIFSQSGKAYTEPKLVLFRSATQSACGGAQSQVGPHYCPLDSTIYLDETFFDELKKLGGGNSDVAQAYVIAHEVGHHVQNQLGIMKRTEQQRQTDNQISVAVELQADCFAGVWAYSLSQQGVFAPGEINKAIDAAAAVGDDKIQKQTQGQVRPETFTHGSSAQRVQWFNTGYTSGKPAACDTFK